MARPRYRPRRQARYNKLRDAGFLHVEAASLSSARTLNYPEFQTMMKVRRGLQLSFRQMAGRRGWGAAKSGREYQGYVIAWYRRNEFLKHETDKRRKHEPWWQWFQKVSDSLPDERRYTHIRKMRSKAKSASGLSNVARVQISRWVNDLTSSIAKATDVDARHQLRLQRNRLQGLLRM